MSRCPSCGMNADFREVDADEKAQAQDTSMSDGLGDEDVAGSWFSGSDTVLSCNECQHWHFIEDREP